MPTLPSASPYMWNFFFKQPCHKTLLIPANKKTFILFLHKQLVIQTSFKRLMLNLESNICKKTSIIPSPGCITSVQGNNATLSNYNEHVDSILPSIAVSLQQSQCNKSSSKYLSVALFCKNYVFWNIMGNPECSILKHSMLVPLHNMSIIK